MRPPSSPARARRHPSAPPPGSAGPRGAAGRRTVLTAVAAAALALAAALPAPALAQADATDSPPPPRVRRAFEPALAFALATTVFGTRASDERGTYTYTPGLGVAATAQFPTSRRTAFMLDASFSPFSKQEASNTAALALVTASHTAIVAADAGFAARLKADVPVFFFLGGGAMHASRVARPLGSGGATEPRGTVALGFDGGMHSESRLGFRALAAAHLTKPADQGVAGTVSKSMAADFSFRLGVRWRLSETALR